MYEDELTILLLLVS